MSKWVIILHESETDDVEVIRQTVKKAGGEVIYISDQRPFIYMQFQPEKIGENDPRLNEPM